MIKNEGLKLLIINNLEILKEMDSLPKYGFQEVINIRLRSIQT